MRHDRRADDPDGEAEGARAAQARHQALGELSVLLAADGEEQVHEAEADQPQQGNDRQLEAPVAPLFQAQDDERDDRGDQAGREQRDAEDEVEPDGGADELGEIGGHRHDLGLQPQQHVSPPAEPVPAQFGQAAAGRQPGLGGEVLHQDGHQVGHDDHP